MLSRGVTSRGTRVLRAFFLISISVAWRMAGYPSFILNNMTNWSCTSPLRFLGTSGLEFWCWIV